MARETYPPDTDYPPITQGYLVPPQRYHTLLLSPDLPLMYGDSVAVLCIYALYPRLSRVTCYPLSCPTVFKLYVALAESSPRAIGRISSALGDFQIIHTTGLAQHDEQYTVEYYCAGGQSKDVFYRLVDKIVQLSGILVCVGEFIPMSGGSP